MKYLLSLIVFLIVRCNHQSPSPIQTSSNPNQSLISPPPNIGGELTLIPLYFFNNPSTHDNLPTINIELDSTQNGGYIFASTVAMLSPTQTSQYNLPVYVCTNNSYHSLSNSSSCNNNGTVGNNGMPLGYLSSIGGQGLNPVQTMTSNSGNSFFATQDSALAARLHQDAGYTINNETLGYSSAPPLSPVYVFHSSNGQTSGDYLQTTLMNSIPSGYTIFIGESMRVSLVATGSYTVPLLSCIYNGTVTTHFVDTSCYQYQQDTNFSPIGYIDPAESNGLFPINRVRLQSVNSHFSSVSQSQISLFINSLGFVEETDGQGNPLVFGYTTL